MTLVLELTPEQTARLEKYAAERGTNPPAALTEFVDQLPSAEVPALKRRIPGLNSGNVLYISPDFDDPLPDSFWFSDDEEENGKF